jgi:hypothetical protein
LDWFVLTDKLDLAMPGTGGTTMHPIVAGHGAAARVAASLTAALLMVVLLAGLPARGCAQPITIGFAEALTGGLAVVGK